MESLMTYAQDNASSGSGMSTFWWVIGAIGLWKMFEKAGEPGWAGIIPFYRQYKLCEKVMNDPWYWVRLFVAFIPIVGWVLAIYFQYQIGKATAKAYGQPDGWAWGYTFLSPVFYCITGFGSYDYYGPYGAGDRRTSEARSARTVDFDVVKQEPVAEPVKEPVVEVYEAPAAQAAQAKAEEVEFEFDQE